MSEIDIDQLRARFSYNPDTGEISRHGVVLQGERKAGYIRHRFEGHGSKKILAHRIAFALMRGRWPSAIDHINGDRADNRWANLREADASLNGINQPNRRNKFGYRGVYKSPTSTGYQAEANWGGKRVYLGTFPTPETAHQAYVDAMRMYYDTTPLRWL